MKKLLPYFFIFLVIAIFFRSFFLEQRLPIPADSLVGLYNPFRDFFAVDYPRGMPFKNFLITDPVRQEYVWRFLSYQLETKGIVPLWNPYNGLGMPLLANQQSAVFYPLNLLFFLLPFATAWSIEVFLTPLLGAWFLYLYLRQIKISAIGSVFAGIAFAFCGFTTSWLEWNTVVQSFLWFPFILWSIEKVYSSETLSKRIIYTFLASFGLVFSLFAGHLQTFFYVSVVSLIYFFVKSLANKKNFLWKYFLLFTIVFGVISLIQLIPTFQLIGLSARNVDLDWTKVGWFIPVQHLLQFFIPDFFGNPTTLNYWGVWNYGEMVGYIGIIPLIFSFIGGFFVRRKMVFFYVGVLLTSLLFATTNPVATLPFVLHIPLLSTSQPTRLLSLIDFSLIVLAAFGIDHLRNISRKQLLIVIGIFGVVFASIWVFLLFGHRLFQTIQLENLLTAKRNTVLPTGLFILGSLVILAITYSKKQKVLLAGMTILLLLTVYDGTRFVDKFNPFISSQLLYPSTKVISFLQDNLGNYRYMTTDDRILPPNVGAFYQVQSLDVYDPLYLQRYGEFIAAVGRGKPSINPPFGFNRIITPHTFGSPFMNLLGVKYILSLDNIDNPGLKKVFAEGQTNVYENTHVFPRGFFVKEVVSALSKQQAIEKLYQIKNSLRDQAVVEGFPQEKSFTKGNVVITKYTASEVDLDTVNLGEGFLVFSDSFYPTWHAFLDGKEVPIYATDYVLRGIIVPQGKHTIAFRVALF